ncbi:MAG TPA: IS1595 family transposase [Thermoguttaceae bacterium]|nr:IS1595 family transposase [Thermoguttaceae bacterium]
MPTPKTLMEAVRYYADPEVCHQLMVKAKWPDGKIVCPECGGRSIGEIKSRRMFQCRECRKQFSAKVGTIFEDSPLPLDKWFVAVWCVANCKNGISSYELARAIGVTQKTAWFVLHRIRLAMEASAPDTLDGPTEADTTYVGGKAENMHAKRRERVIHGRGAVGKTAVHGILQRGKGDDPSQVRTGVLGRETQVSLLREVRSRVRYGSQVYTDAASAYGDLCLTHCHKAVDHTVCYVDGDAHTNGIENFWSLFKRTLKGTYIAVAPFHLYRYVEEQAFRFNNRLKSDFGRFQEILSKVAHKRLTYRVLCAIDDAGFMGIL